MNKIIFRLIIGLVVLQAFIVRFWNLAIIPYETPSIFLLRIVTAISGSITIPIFIYLFYKYFKNRKLGLIAGWWLSVLPWHIEQSRIYSIYPIFLFLFIFILLVNSTQFNKLKVFFSILAILIFISFFKPFWFQFKHFTLISIMEILSNFSRQLSFEFIFFKNESFWSGGFRNFGVIFPEAIPIFLVGIFSLAKKTKIAVYSLIIIITLLIISSLNSTFPETRDFFLSIPVLILVITLGSYEIYNWCRKNFYSQLLGICYFFILIYGFIQFFHFYFTHYAIRVVNDKSYETSKF